MIKRHIPRFPLSARHPSVSMIEMELPKNKSAQAAQHLKELILTGHYSSTLPSERQLSEQLLISRNCVRDALMILTKEAVLAPPEKSKRRVILLTPSDQPQRNITRCIFITPTPEHSAPPKLLSQLARLRNLLASSSISVELRCPEAFRRKNPTETLTKLVKEYPNSLWILHQTPESFQQWFEQSGLPTLLFGSAFDSVSLPSIDSDHAAAVRHSVGELSRLGHKRIALILPRTTLAGAQHAEHGLTSAIEQSAHEINGVILRHDFNVPRLTASMNALFQGPTPPTAIIVQNHHHFLTIYSHLMSLGLRIPYHVSLVSLVDDPSFERLSPTPSCYSTDGKLLRALASAITNIHKKKSLSSLTIPEYLPGQTVDKLYPA